MHAFKLPFTGLFVGGFAVLCVGLLAYVERPAASTILRATALVLLVKAVVSPHSPPPFAARRTSSRGCRRSS